jgi:Ni/Co efflux regulator RcnB
MKANPSRRALVVALALAFLPAPALADKPDWAGKGKGNRERGEDREGDRDRDRGERHFREEHRVAVHDYYEHEFNGGKRCPPGLAKKHNGCMPPGQARKWQMGRPLPRDVVYYPVPHDLEVTIGVPPAGYKYVRVASDILMIAAGTGIVADAIQDLGRR